MDAKTQEILQLVLNKNPEALTSSEVAFLRARRDYLNNEQKKVFAMHLEGLAKAPKSKADAEKPSKEVEDTKEEKKEVEPESEEVATISGDPKDGSTESVADPYDPDAK